MAWACVVQPPPWGPRGSACATLCGPGLRFLLCQPPASDIQGGFLHLLATSALRTLGDLLSVLPENSCSELAPGPVSPNRLSPLHCPYIALGEPCGLPCPHDTPFGFQIPQDSPLKGCTLFSASKDHTPKKVLLCPWLVPFVGIPQPPSVFRRSSEFLHIGEWVAFLLWASVAPQPGRLHTPYPGPASLASSSLLTPPSPEKLNLCLLLFGTLTPQGTPVAGSHGARGQLPSCCHFK